MAQVVETILKLQGSRAFQQAAQQSARAIGSIGTESEKSGQKAKVGWKGVAKWAGGTAAIYGAGRFLKGAVSQTEDLAKSTMTLQRATGLDARTASSWAEITKVRGINTKQFQVGLTKLSKVMEAARAGNKKALATLQQYGVTQDQIQSGDIGGTINNLADSFALMENPAEKAALAQSLFGKSGQALVPILSGGSKGIQEQMEMVQKYGATLGSTDEAKEMIAKQREMQFAMDGLKITLGTKLMPAMLAFVDVLSQIVTALQPVLRNSTLLYITLGILTAAYVALKVAMIAATISGIAFNATVGWIALAIAAVIVVVILLVKNWDKVTAAFKATWTWVKANWPTLLAILTGPLGIATLIIIRNFDKIKKAASDAVHWIANRFRDLINFVKRIPGAIAGTVKSLGSSALHALPGLQTGGTIQRGGYAMVGEAGPEVVALPRGATVFPTPDVGAVANRPPLDTRGHNIITKVYLDKRQIAEAVGTYASDKQARR